MLVADLCTHYHMQRTSEGSVFGAVGLCFFCLCMIYISGTAGFMPNLHGRRVWSLARTSLKVVVKGQGDQC